MRSNGTIESKRSELQKQVQDNLDNLNIRKSSGSSNEKYFFIPPINIGGIEYNMVLLDSNDNILEVQEATTESNPYNLHLNRIGADALEDLNFKINATARINRLSKIIERRNLGPNPNIELNDGNLSLRQGDYLDPIFHSDDNTVQSFFPTLNILDEALNEVSDPIDRFEQISRELEARKYHEKSKKTYIFGAEDLSNVKNIINLAKRIGVLSQDRVDYFLNLSSNQAYLELAEIFYNNHYHQDYLIFDSEDEGKKEGKHRLDNIKQYPKDQSFRKQFKEDFGHYAQIKSMEEQLEYLTGNHYRVGEEAIKAYDSGRNKVRDDIRINYLKRIARKLVGEGFDVLLQQTNFDSLDFSDKAQDILDVVAARGINIGDIDKNISNIRKKSKSSQKDYNVYQYARDVLLDERKRANLKELYQEVYCNTQRENCDKVFVGEIKQVIRNIYKEEGLSEIEAKKRSEEEDSYDRVVDYLQNRVKDKIDILYNNQNGVSKKDIEKDARFVAQEKSKTDFENEKKKKLGIESEIRVIKSNIITAQEELDKAKKRQTSAEEKFNKEEQYLKTVKEVYKNKSKDIRQADKRKHKSDFEYELKRTEELLDSSKKYSHQSTKLREELELLRKEVKDLTNNLSRVRDKLLQAKKEAYDKNSVLEKAKQEKEELKKSLKVAKKNLEKYQRYMDAANDRDSKLSLQYLVEGKHYKVNEARFNRYIEELISHSPKAGELNKDGGSINIGVGEGKKAESIRIDNQNGEIRVLYNNVDGEAKDLTYKDVRLVKSFLRKVEDKLKVDPHDRLTKKAGGEDSYQEQLFDLIDDKYLLDIRHRLKFDDIFKRSDLQDNRHLFVVKFQNKYYQFDSISNTQNRTIKVFENAEDAKRADSLKGKDLKKGEVFGLYNHIINNIVRDINMDLGGAILKSSSQIQKKEVYVDRSGSINFAFSENKEIASVEEIDISRRKILANKIRSLHEKEGVLSANYSFKREEEEKDNYYSINIKHKSKKDEGMIRIHYHKNNPDNMKVFRYRYDKPSKSFKKLERLAHDEESAIIEDQLTKICSDLEGNYKKQEELLSPIPGDLYKYITDGKKSMTHTASNKLNKFLGNISGTQMEGSDKIYRGVGIDFRRAPGGVLVTDIVNPDRMDRFKEIKYNNSTFSKVTGSKIKEKLAGNKDSRHEALIGKVITEIYVDNRFVRVDLLDNSEQELKKYFASKGKIRFVAKDMSSRDKTIFECDNSKVQTSIFVRAQGGSKMLSEMLKSDDEQERNEATYMLNSYLRDGKAKSKDMEQQKVAFEPWEKIDSKIYSLQRGVASPNDRDPSPSPKPAHGRLVSGSNQKHGVPKV